MSDDYREAPPPLPIFGLLAAIFGGIGLLILVSLLALAGVALLLNMATVPGPDGMGPRLVGLLVLSILAALACWVISMMRGE